MTMRKKCSAEIDDKICSPEVPRRFCTNSQLGDDNLCRPSECVFNFQRVMKLRWQLFTCTAMPAANLVGTNSSLDILYNRFRLQ